MPFPTQFEGQFFGDYTGLSAVDNAYPAWMDTRNPGSFLCPGSGTATTAPQVCTATVAPSGVVANDQDIYTASMPVPSR
jgi:hypothetical protein